MNGSWLAAVLAPWAIAPHPNFTVKTVTAPERLALSLNMRDHQLARYEGRLETEYDWELDILAAAEIAVHSGGVGVAEELASMAIDRRLPLGPRTVAALLVTYVRVSEDRPRAALDFLGPVTTDLTEQLSALDRPSHAAHVAQAALQLQCAVRSLETGQEGAARLWCEETQRSLDRVRDSWLAVDEPFIVSRGIGWGWKQVQRDLVATLRQHALKLRAKLDAFEQPTWVRVVKSRPAWPDIRSGWQVESALSKFLSSAFEERTAAITSISRFGGRDEALASLMGALVYAELSADASGIVQARERLGKYQLLRAQGEARNSLEQAIQLLRRADAKDSFGAALGWAKARGPMQTIAAEARGALERAREGERIARCDLITFSLAAELLDATERTQALDAIENFMAGDIHEESSGLRRYTEAREDMGWRAVRALLPGSSQEGQYLTRLVSHITSGHVLLPADRGLIGVVRVADWSLLADDTAQNLLKWAITQKTSDYRVLAEAIYVAVDGPEGARRTFPHPQGLALAAQILADYSDGVSPATEELQRAVDACQAAMRRVLDEANLGMYSRGGYDPADIAVALINAFAKFDLWLLLLDLLANERIARSQKQPALDRIARLRVTVPPELMDRISVEWERWSAGEVSLPFESEVHFPVLPEAIRAGVVTGAISSQQAMVALAPMAAMASPEARIEAARTVPFATSTADEWAVFLLLQLSSDADPMVQAEAGFAVGRLSWPGGGLGQALEEKAVALLESPGGYIPLAVLQGMQMSDAPNWPTPVMSAVGDLRLHHESSDVRRLAQMLLSRSEESHGA